MAYRLVWHVVVMRAPLGILLEGLRMERRLALRVLENELLTIEAVLARTAAIRASRSRT